MENIPLKIISEFYVVIRQIFEKPNVHTQLLSILLYWFVKYIKKKTIKRYE